MEKPKRAYPSDSILLGFITDEMYAGNVVLPDYLADWLDMRENDTAHMPRL